MSFPEEAPAYTLLCLSPNSSDPFPVQIQNEHGFMTLMQNVDYSLNRKSAPVPLHITEFFKKQPLLLIKYNFVIRATLACFHSPFVF